MVRPLMNVSTIKAVCWLVSLAVLSLGVWYGYDFLSTIDARQATFDKPHAEEVLKTSGQSGDIVRQRVISYPDEVKPSWISANWTGKAPPERPKIVEQPQEVVKRHTPVETLLKVQMVQFDGGDASASFIYVAYLPAGGFPDETGKLFEGDSLPGPHPEVKVYKIEPGVVEFAYEGFDVENDRIEPPRALAVSNVIVYTDEDGIIQPAARRTIPVGEPRKDVYEKTTLVGLDRWVVGTEDAAHFNENYSQILTRDVSHRTHHDANGRRAGIEITRVRPGSIAARHGVQEGDIVISVNGHPVSSAQEAISFAKQNKDKYTVWTVEIERLGTRKTLTYDTQQNN